MFVLAFFLVYYKTFGIVTNLALLLNLLMVVAHHVGARRHADACPAWPASR